MIMRERNHLNFNQSEIDLYYDSVKVTTFIVLIYLPISYINYRTSNDEHLRNSLSLFHYDIYHYDI